MLYLVYNQLIVSQWICVELLPWKNKKSGSVRGQQVVRKPYIFVYFFEIFSLLLQFSTLESCYIWFRISLEYPSAYVYSCYLGKIPNQGLSGDIMFYENPILSQFCHFLFLSFFVFLFSFPHWNHVVIFGLQLVQSILLHMCTYGGMREFVNPMLSFSYF